MQCNFKMIELSIPLAWGGGTNKPQHVIDEYYPDL